MRTSIGLLFGGCPGARQPWIGVWEWIAVPALVAVLFLWFAGHFDTQGAASPSESNTQIRPAVGHFMIAYTSLACTALW
jgi:hypothetical protein